MVTDQGGTGDVQPLPKFENMFDFLAKFSKILEKFCQKPRF